MPGKDEGRETIRNGIIFAIVGLAMLVAAGWLGRKPYVIWRRWPKTDAVVTRGDIYQYYVSRDDDRGGLVSRYKAQIEFRYAVEGKEYVCWAMASPYSGSYDKMKRRLATTYAPGTRHSVRYNPADPSDIRVDLSFDIDTVLMFTAFLVLGLVFTAAAVNAVRASYLAAAEGSAYRPPGLWQRIKTSSPILRFRSRSGLPSQRPAGTIRCPWCGKHVPANLNTCPKCSRPLRAG